MPVKSLNGRLNVGSTHRMNTETLIAECLGVDSLDGLSVAEAASPAIFKSYQLFTVHYYGRGQNRPFDFVSLPHGSYAYVAVCQHGAVRLRHRGRGLETVLRHEWNFLKKADPVDLAQLLLTFLNDGIKYEHSVIRSFDEIMKWDLESKNVNMEALRLIKEEIGTTTSTIVDGRLKIRAISLRGWMHTKQELGIQNLSIASTGTVAVSTRQVLCGQVFTTIPRTIEY